MRIVTSGRIVSCWASIYEPVASAAEAEHQKRKKQELLLLNNIIGWGFVISRMMKVKVSVISLAEDQG